MKEAVIYHKLKAKLRGTFIKRIENSLEIGTPDMYFCNAMCSGWIEAKAVHLPVRDTTPVKVPFRQGQYNWLIGHKERGGTSLLIIHTGDKKGYYMAEGHSIQEVYTLEDFKRARANPYLGITPIRFVPHDGWSALLE